MKIHKSTIHIPSKDKLISILNQTREEVSSIRITLENKKIHKSFISSFIKDCIIRISDITSAISSLGIYDIDSILILMRSSLEVNVDLLWVYSIYKGDLEQGENLAKRFYQFGAKNFLEISTSYPNVFKEDPFLKIVSEKLDPVNDRIKAENTSIIDIVDKNSNRKLRELQKQNWRALPGLIKNREQLFFSNRCNITVEFAEKLFNLKYAPYYKNWQILNSFTHWSPASMKYIEDALLTTFYLRNLNSSLGFLHDVLNVSYDFLEIVPPEKIRMLRQEFVYLST